MSTSTVTVKSGTVALASTIRRAIVDLSTSSSGRRSTLPRLGAPAGTAAGSLLLARPGGGLHVPLDDPPARPGPISASSATPSDAAEPPGERARP